MAKAKQLVEFDIAFKHELVSINDRKSIDLKRVFKRGNTRMFRGLTPKQQAKIPEQVILKNTTISHEVSIISDGPIGTVHNRCGDPCVGPTGDGAVGWNAAWHGDMSAGAADESFIYTLQITHNGKSIGRTPGSSVLFLRGPDGNHRFFYVITWTDLFGRSIKENAVNRLSLDDQERTIKTHYVYEATETHALIQASVTSFFDQFWPVAGTRLDDTHPEWYTSTVLALLKTVDSGEQVHPILADALQDAGCESEMYLQHLREPGVTHHSDCWVIDMLNRGITQS